MESGLRSNVTPGSLRLVIAAVAGEEFYFGCVLQEINTEQRLSKVNPAQPISQVYLMS